MTTPSSSIKPHKMSFLLFQGSLIFILIFVLVASIAFVGFSLFANISAGMIGIVIAFFVVVFGIAYFLVLVRYRKEIYIPESKKIIAHSGTIISDNTTEIAYDCITEVRMRLGFWQQLFFKTGDIIINTAGSAASKLILKNVDQPEKYYEEIRDHMRDNGYHLTQDTLVQEARPHMLGIIGELLQQGSFLIMYLIFAIFSMWNAFESDPQGLSEVMNAGGKVLLFIVVPFFVLILGYVVILYLDLKRRKYDVYTDSIVYTEGFLTKNYAFLPMERVADIENHQVFLSRIFGLHDIVVSSEGVGNQVVFKNMTEGEQMIKNIKYLKEHIGFKAESSSSTVAASDTSEEKVTSDGVDYTDVVETPVRYNQDFHAQYRMNFLKTFLSVIITISFLVALSVVVEFEVILPFVFVVGVGSIGGLIRYFFTDFIVDTNTIDTRFHFLSNKHTTFTIDKISSVSIKESLLDRALGTCSIVFRSIGSGSQIVFADIKKTPDLEKNILEKVGIYCDPTHEEIIPVHFNFGEYIKANIINFIWIFGLLLLLMVMSFVDMFADLFADLYLWVYGVILLVGVFIAFFYKKLYYSASWYKQALYSDCVASASGVIFHQKSYALYRHIKGVVARKNPLTSTGTIYLNIAGASLAPAGKGQKHQMQLFGNTIRMQYMPAVFDLQDRMDSILLGNRPLEVTDSKQYQQTIGNSLALYGSLCLIFCAWLITMDRGVGVMITIPMLIGLGIMVWYLKTKEYVLEKDRVVVKSGIIYRTHASVLYVKFNFIEKNQGFFGKIFSNGTLHVYTIGSITRDLTLADVDQYHEIYDVLKKQEHSPQ